MSAPTRWLPLLWRAALFGLAYAALAWVSDELFRFPGSHIATFWPPSGLTLALLLRAKRSSWWALSLGLLVGAVGEVLLLGMPLEVALGWGLAVLLEPLLGATLLRRYLPGSPWLSHVRDVLVFVGLGAVVAPILSGLLGAAVSAILLERSYLTAWLNWWTSAALGVVLVGPFFLTTPPPPRARHLRWTPARRLEGLLLLVLVAAVAQWIFGAPLPPPATLSLPAYAAVPFLLWGALRFGLPGTATVSATLAVISAWHTAHGHGPFPATIATPHGQVVSVQAFLAVTSLGGLILAATLHERWHAERGQWLLAEVSRLLTESLDERATLAKVARRLVPDFADGFALFLVRNGGTLAPVAVAHVAPSREPLLAHHLDLGPTGSTRFLSRVEPEHLAALARDEAHLRGLEALGPTSLLVLPLRGHQQVLGSLVLLTSSPTRHLDPRDHVLAEDLARRCAVAVEQARLYRQQQEALRSREEFMSIASHELKTPLTPLSLQLDAMKRRLQAGKPLEPTALDRMRHSLQRLVRLINDLLDLARIDAGRLSLEKAPLVLQELVRDVSASFASASALHSLELALPEEAVWVEGDRLRLEQVLTNLLDNAIKYSPLGGTIRVSLHVQGEEALLSVSDPGVGIPEEQQAQLFERYFRARTSSSRSFGGLGLGLFICRDIVERHGGRIWGRSTVGQGSTFSFALPVLKAAHPPADPPQLH